MENKIYTLEDYEKKYRNRRNHLLKFSKEQYEEYNKTISTKKFRFFKNKKWTLIGDTYYQIPRFPSFTWFRNIHIGYQVGTYVLATGIVVTAITLGVMYGTQPKIEYITYTLDSDIELKDLGSDIEVTTNKDVPGKILTHKNKDNADFKVMAFTDLHLDHNKNTCSYTFSMLARNIIKAKPDLVVFCGDNITSSYNEPRTIQFAEMLEKLGVYWCAVLGNHEKNYSNPHCIERDHMINIWCRYPHCLIDNSTKKTGGGATVWGVGNTLLNLASNKGITQSLYFLDSGTEMNAEQVEEYCDEIIKYKEMNKCSLGETEFYDYIKYTQVLWYQETFNKVRTYVTKKGADAPHSTIFTHVPIVEQETGYIDLFNTWEDKVGKTKSSIGSSDNLRVFVDYPQEDSGTGICAKDVNQLYESKEGFVKGVRNRRREDLCYSPHDLRYKYQDEKTKDRPTPILKAMESFGDNNALFAGHDHSNNYTIKVGGQFLGYINSGCYSSNNLYTKGLLGEDPYKVDEGTYGGHLTQGYTDLVYKQNPNSKNYNIIDSITVKENYDVWKTEKPELYTRALDLIKTQLWTGKSKVYVDSHKNYLDSKDPL